VGHGYGHSADDTLMSKLHRPEFLAEVRAHFNEPMLSMFSVVRCVGYGEDDCDCYIIAQRPNPKGDLIWLTMVGGYTFLDRLKGQGHVVSTSGEDWDDLFRLDHVLALNGAPKAEEFIVKIEHETSWGDGLTDPDVDDMP
jgi:hypothetical protein